MRILALTHRLPYAPNRGDRIRSYHILRKLASCAEVHLFSLADRDDVQHVGDLEGWLSSVTVVVPPRAANLARGIVSLPGSRPLTHTLLSSPNAAQQVAQLAVRARPDVVFAYCSGVAALAVDDPLSRHPFVLDMVDVDSLKWEALSRTTPFPLGWIYRREARVLRAFEAHACSRASVTLVVNAREQRALSAIVPEAAITVVENGIDAAYFSPAVNVDSAPTIVFCGVMDYQPNAEAVTWFAEQVFPKVRRTFAQASFWIIGARPTTAVRRLGTQASVHVTGAVDDVRPFLWRAQVSVAPLFTARGLQNKVLEALAARLPVVTTPAVAEGLPAAALPGCRVASSAEGFRDAVVELLTLSSEERCAISNRVDFSSLTWEARLQKLPELFETAARSGSTTAR